MKIVKIEDGLLEQDNFFTSSPFSHFTGDYQATVSNGIFTLKSGFIERRFQNKEYVIVVEKKDVSLNQDDSFSFYVRKKQERSGIIESRDNGLAKSSHWKLIRKDGFIQGYYSSNGIDWSHVGGGEIASTDVQGFQITGDTYLDITDYKVYRSPYLTVHGFDEGSRVVIESHHGDVISETISDNRRESKLLMEYPVQGRIKAVDENGALIYETDIIELKYGDVFAVTSYELELYYQGQLIDHSPTMLNTTKESVIIKNASSDVYTNIFLSIVVLNTDTITMSFDDIDYHSNLELSSISPNEEVRLFLKIEKDRDKPSYGTRQFILEVD